jgi:hypothetical protein
MLVENYQNFQLDFLRSLPAYYWLLLASVVIFSIIEFLIINIAHSYLVSNKNFNYSKADSFRDRVKYIFIGFSLFFGKFAYDDKLKKLIFWHRLCFVIWIILLIVLIKTQLSLIFNNGAFYF